MSEEILEGFAKGSPLEDHPPEQRGCVIAAERLCSTSRLPGFTSQMCPLQCDCGQVTYLLCSLPELPQILQYPRICIQPAREVVQQE